MTWAGPLSALNASSGIATRARGVWLAKERGMSRAGTLTLRPPLCKPVQRLHARNERDRSSDSHRLVRAWVDKCNDARLGVVTGLVVQQVRANLRVH